MQRASTLIALLALVAFPAAASGESGAATRPPLLARLTSTPALYPAYSSKIHDYVVRCQPGQPVRFTTVAAAGSAPWIDGKPGRTALVPLARDQAVTIEARNGSGSAAYHVRCLPTDFPEFTETRSGSTASWYIATPSLSLGKTRSHYIVIFDGNGVPVWWYKTLHVPIDAKLLPGPAIAFSSYPEAVPEYQVRTFAGTFVRRIVSPDGRVDSHELQVDANGNYWFLVYQPKPGVDLTQFGGPPDAIVLEAEIEEVSPQGALLWSWTTDGHVDLSESRRWLDGTIIPSPVPIPGNAKGYDFFHANAISLDGNVVLLSLRQTDGVYAIDKQSGRILWKLGGTQTPESLTVADDPYGQVPLGGQHDVRIQPDGTVSVFDDGSFLNRPPRMARFRIDTATRTATLVQQISDPAVTTSICCGSARSVPNGDWVVSWGGDPVFGEYRSDGTPVFKITFGDDLFSYRVAPVAPGDLTIAELRAGMDVLATRR